MNFPKIRLSIPKLSSGLIPGLILFYLSLLVTGNKAAYFAIFAVTGLIFYYKIRSIPETLLYLLVLSIFFDVGVGGKNFLLLPYSLDQGSGWWISATTLILMTWTFYVLGKGKTGEKREILTADILLFLFFVWNALGTAVNNNFNSLLGFLQLTETVFIYLILRMSIKSKSVHALLPIIISMILFQSIFAVLQYVNRSPLGLIIEPVNQQFDPGKSVIEGTNVFRSTGTFGHANMLAAFMIGLGPFVLMIKNVSYYVYFLYLLILFVILLTYSRISWVFLGIQILFMRTFRKSMNLRYPHLLSSRKFIIPTLTIILILVLTPFLLTRAKTSGNSLFEFGSLGMRVKMTQEALNLIDKYPLWGTGLARSLETYSQNPATNIFSKGPPSSFYKIHNTFLEIASESGIPGLILFVIFILTVLFKKPNKDNPAWLPALIGFSGLLITAYVNPFFHTPVFRILILLAAILIA